MSFHLLPASRFTDFLNLRPRLSPSSHLLNLLSHLPLLPPLSSPPYQQLQITIAVTGLTASFLPGRIRLFYPLCPHPSHPAKHSAPVGDTGRSQATPLSPASTTLLLQFSLTLLSPFLHLSPLPGSKENVCFTRL